MNNQNENQGHQPIQFTGEIQIVVSIQQIANRLFDAMDKTNPHARMIADYTVANLMKSPKGISAIYNALNGYEYKLDFAKDDLVLLRSPRTYNWDNQLAKYVEDYDSPVVVGTIVNVDTFDEQPIKVKYSYVNMHGEVTTVTKHYYPSELLSADKDDYETWSETLDNHKISDIDESQMH